MHTRVTRCIFSRIFAKRPGTNWSRLNDVPAAGQKRTDRPTIVSRLEQTLDSNKVKTPFPFSAHSTSDTHQKENLAIMTLAVHCGSFLREWLSYNGSTAVRARTRARAQPVSSPARNYFPVKGIHFPLQNVQFFVCVFIFSRDYKFCSSGNTTCRTELATGPAKLPVGQTHAPHWQSASQY